MIFEYYKLRLNENDVINLARFLVENEKDNFLSYSFYHKEKY